MFRNILFAAAATGLLSATAFAQTAPQATAAPSASSWPSIVGGASASVTGSPHDEKYHTQHVFRTQNAPDPEAYPYGVDEDWQIPVKSHS